MGPCNVIIGPRKVILGPCNINRGPWNVKGDRGMLIGDCTMWKLDRGM